VSAFLQTTVSIGK